VGIYENITDVKLKKEKGLGKIFIFTYSALYILFVAVIVSLGFYFYQKIVHEQEVKLYNVIGSLAVESINKVAFSGRYHTQLLLDELVVKNDDIEYIIITEPDGDLLAHSGIDEELLGERGEKIVPSNSTLAISDREILKGGGKSFIKEIEVPYSGGYMNRHQGNIYIGISTDSLTKSIKDGIYVFTVFFISVLPLGLFIIYKSGKMYQEPIRRLAYKFEGVMEYSPIPIVFYGAEGTIIEASKAFVDRFGMDEAESNIYSLNEAFALEGFKHQDMDVFEQNKVIESSLNMIIRNKEFYFQSIKIPVIKDEHKTRIMALLLNDVTNLIRREQELEQNKDELEQLNKNLEHRVNEELVKNREKDDLVIKQSRFAAMGEMSNNIAHNWRQPLAIIGATLLNIGDSYEDGSLTKEYLDKELHIANKTLEKLSKTIDDFRDFFKPASVKSRFFIAKEVERAIKLVEASILSRNIILLFEKKCECEAFGYPNEFSQVVLNILSNARDVLIERAVPNPKIEIFLYARDGKNILDIIDNAGGVEESLVHKLFDPYFSTKPVDKGSGLGLFMSKSIIEKNMDGSIVYIKEDDRSIFRIEV